MGFAYAPPGISPVELAGNFSIGGTSYSASILTRWSAAALAAINVYEIVEPEIAENQRVVSSQLVFLTSPDRVERIAEIETISDGTQDPDALSAADSAAMAAAAAERAETFAAQANDARSDMANQMMSIAIAVTNTNARILALDARLTAIE